MENGECEEIKNGELNIISCSFGFLNVEFRTSNNE